nr:unnamed protein product [Callosobruchus chinensis]
MDILVKRSDGTENIVSKSQIQFVKRSDSLRKGAQIKMYWKPEKEWNFGVVIAIEDHCFSSDSESNIPLETLWNDLYTDSDDAISLHLIKQKNSGTAVRQINVPEVVTETNNASIIQADVTSFQTTGMDQSDVCYSANHDLHDEAVSSYSQPCEFKDNSDEDPT